MLPPPPPPVENLSAIGRLLERSWGKLVSHGNIMWLRDVRSRESRWNKWLEKKVGCSVLYFQTQFHRSIFVGL